MMKQKIMEEILDEYAKKWDFKNWKEFEENTPQAFHIENITSLAIDKTKIEVERGLLKGYTADELMLSMERKKIAQKIFADFEELYKYSVLDKKYKKLRKKWVR